MLLLIGILQWNKSEVVLEWTTETELNTIGFNIYRTTNPDSELVKINPVIIPSSSNPLTGGEYSFRDTNTERNQEYFYYLEEVTTSGTSERHGPISIIARGKFTIYIVTGIVFIGIFFVTKFDAKQQKNEL